MKRQIKALIADMVACLDQDPQVHELSDTQVEALIKNFPPAHCIGRCLPYIFSVTRNRYLYIGPRVGDITGYSAKEWKAESMADFLPRIVQPEHLILLCKASLACFQKMRGRFQNGSYELQVNMDFTLVRKDGQPCRVMMQFRPLIWDEDGNVKITGGFLVEIDHLKKQGLPVITLTSFGEVLYMYSPAAQDLADIGLTRFSPRELDILQMIAKGDDVNDIMQKTRLSRATVYAHRRNIIAKSEFSTITKVIDSLRSKGIIS